MTYIVGNAVEIFCEIPSDKVDGTTLTLESLVDPDETDWAASEELTFSEVSGKENVASVVFQTTKGTHPVGKYGYIIKAVNGTRENFAKGNFYLTEQ